MKKSAEMDNGPFHYPEGDAHTLAEASAIKKDASRMKAAKEAAQKMVKEKADMLQGLKNVAKSKIPTKKKKK